MAVLIATRASLPTPLSASHRTSPAGPYQTSMLRTVPPPLGIGHDSIFFVSGLKRTRTLRLPSPVSQYQIAPSEAVVIA